jgi:hypothetical protein
METYTFTGTASYSVADVKAVMQNTFEDIIGFANRGMVEFEKAKGWIEDLTYMLNKNALKEFELQLYNSIGRFKSYRYQVETNGLVLSGEPSGGIDYYSIPSTTKVGIYADLDQSSNNYNTVMTELVNRRGWGTNGSRMEGTAVSERTYASNSLQLKRSVIF